MVLVMTVPSCSLIERHFWPDVAGREQPATRRLTTGVAELDDELLGDSADAVMAFAGEMTGRTGDGRPLGAWRAACQATARQIALATMTWSM